VLFDDSAVRLVREDLTPVEEANTISVLLDDLNITAITWHR